MKSSFDAQLEAIRPSEKVLGNASGEFWSIEDPIIGSDKQVVVGGMWQPQRDFWNLPNFIKAMVGGYGAGKTLIGSKRIIASALHNAPAPVAAISPSFGMAKKTTVETIRELLAGKRSLLGRHFDWKYHTTDHTFHIWFRGRHARIQIASGENPDALKGPNLGAAWIDEPFIQDVEVFKQMLARVRHPEARRKEIFLTGTPENLGWGYELCEGEMKERYDVGYVRASTRANLALDGYADRLTDAYTGKEAEAYVEGEFVNLAEGVVYHAFDKPHHVVHLDPPSDIVRWGAGMDFNVDPMSAVVFWETQNGHIHITNEFELRNSDTEYMCDEIMDVCPEVTDVFPDATGSARKTSAATAKSDFFYIREAGFNLYAKSRNPKRRDRYTAVNSRFKSDKLTISPACTKLQTYLMQYTFENMDKKSGECMSHLLDAFGYPIVYLYPVNKELLREVQIVM